MPQACPTEYQALGYYSVENAEKWLDLDAFMAWLSRSFQSPLKEKLGNSLTVGSASTPVASRVEASIASKNPNRSQAGASSSLFASTPRNSRPRHSSPPIEISDSSEYESTPSKPQKKRKRRKSPPLRIKLEDSDNLEVEVVQVKPTKAARRRPENSDSDCEVEVVERKQRNAKESASAHPQAKKRQKRTTDDDNRVQITRQFSCKKIITLTRIPTCWSVPYDFEEVVYLLDLTQDTREWKDKNGDLMSMAAIIKSVVHDFSYAGSF